MLIKQKGDYTIRSLEIDDIETIVEIYETITGQDSPDESDLENRMDYGDSLLCLGAETRGELVGFIFGEVRRAEYGETESVGWIGLLGIHPQHRGKELGRTLGEELLHQFRGLGIQRVRTTVSNQNTSLLKFFMNLGLKPADWTMLEFSQQ